MSTSQALLLGWLAMGAAFVSLVASYKASKKTKVRLRGVFCLVNRLKSKASTVDDKVLSLLKPIDTLFEEVLVEERKAFGDTPAVDNAKRSLHMIQNYGAFEEGNRFSSVGQTLILKVVEKNLRRRIAFAKRCQIELPTESSRQNIGGKVVIIAGLPRTGSTMLHRLLSADPTTRTPLWWEQAMDDDEQLPCAPEDLLVDPRAEAVERDIVKGMSMVSPNALAEFNKFHKIGAYEVEEVAVFMRRYWNDMDGCYFSPACLEKRRHWMADDKVDKRWDNNNTQRVNFLIKI